jgi:two-component system sensor histidine kinase UhpB
VESLKEMQEVVQAALENVRRVSQRLHPNVLDDYGLEGAVEWYSKQAGDQSGIAVTFLREPGQALVVPPEVAIHVYRIVQESLNNLVRHSHSEKAWVRIGRHGDVLRVEVEDRGDGLPEAPAQRNGLGLVAMRERAELVKGQLTLTRPQEGGTLVRLEVPLTVS